MHRSTVPAVALGLGIAAGASAGGVVPCTIVVAQGDALAGSTVDVINNPTATPMDKVGFNLSFASGDRAVWFDAGPLFFNSDFTPEVVTGAEGGTGVSEAGDSIYSPSVDGGDSVIINQTAIFGEPNMAPAGTDWFLTFASRPGMATSAGVGYWVSGLNETDGNGGSDARAFFSYDPNTTTATLISQSGDSFSYDGGTFNIAFPAGVDFDYGVSPSANHLMQVFLADTGSSTNDGFILIDGMVIAREGDPIAGTLENWDNFDIMSVNDNGDYIFTGDTDGATSSDEFLAVNGEIAIREGDTVGGVLFESGTFMRGAVINNGGFIAHAWDNGPSEVLFLSTDLNDALGSAIRIVGIGDVLDTNNDGAGDFEVTDITASTATGNSLGLSDSAIYMTMDVIPVGGGDEIEILARFALPGDVTPCPADLDMDGTVGFTDLTAVLAAWGPCPGCPADFDGDGTVGFNDLTTVLAAWGACP